jgi:polyvinyl alcohol dehydrogenase (cytochrome)
MRLLRKGETGMRMSRSRGAPGLFQHPTSPHVLRRATVLAALAALLSVSGGMAASPSGDWSMAGHDLQNTRFASTETTIGVGNASTLATKWVATTNGDVSATPAVNGGAVYFPDWGGMLWARNASTGALLWSNPISTYTGVSGDLARATPAVNGNLLILGDQPPYGNPASIFAVNKQTGALVWKTQADTHLASIITAGAVVDPATGIVYVGVSSNEEADAAFIPGYTCCTFRGSMLALNSANGNILWRTYTVPAGYSGGSVWGSTAVVDPSRGNVYITTGNNYTMPQSVIDCAGTNPTQAQIQACLSPDDHFDSVMALNLQTGAIKWSFTALPSDAWNVSCIPGFQSSGNCPANAGPDYDFGQGPALITTSSKNGSMQILGAGQKSGQYWAFNPSTGAVIWVTQVGPGSSLGGLEWGSATDGSRIYAADTNLYQIPTKLVNGQTVTSGFWSALDVKTGAIIWQTADPLGAIDPGAVSAADGVVFACSMDFSSNHATDGHMYALKASSGAILWSFASGGSCNAGAAIANGVVYWGSGYSHLGASLGSGNNKFYAFAPKP